MSRSGHKSLRGCIGTFEEQELAEGLKSYALTSYVFPKPCFYIHENIATVYQTS
jgi:AMMECR1 domain-containing protein